MKQRGFLFAKRRYHRVFWPLMVAYAVLLIGGEYWVSLYDTAPLALRVGAGLASALPLVGVLLVILRYFAETDEYTRLRQLTAFARGAVFTMSIVFIVGFLQIFEAISSFDVFWFGPLFFASWGVAFCLQNRLGKTV
jgi:hypothetical protein